MIMGHVGDTAFLPGGKKHHQVTWAIRIFCPGENTISSHSEHSAVLRLTLHTVSNRQKGKCMINGL